MKCGFWKRLWKKIKKKYNEDFEEEYEIHPKVPIDVQPQMIEIQEDHSDELLEQMKALGTGNLGSGLSDMNFKGSIIHIEDASRSQSSLHSTLDRTKKQTVRISIDGPPADLNLKETVKKDSFDQQEPLQYRASTLRRKKEKRDSTEIVKPLIDLTPTNVITKGALLDTMDKKVKPPLDPKLNRSKSRSRSQNFEETLARSKSIKKDDGLSRKKSQKYVEEDDLFPSKSVSRKPRNVDSDVELARSKSKSKRGDDSSSNNDDNVPLGTTLSRTRSKKASGLSRSRSRKEVAQKRVGTDEDISDRPPDYDIEPIRSTRQQSEKGRSKGEPTRSKSQRSKRSISKRPNGSDESDDDQPLANVALQALQMNLANTSTSRLR